VSSDAGSAATEEVDYSDWDAVLEAAKGQTVTWYGWGGSQPRNTWIETELAPALKEKYDITLDLVGMDINDILTQLSGDKQANAAEGTIDFIWINGENFYTAKDNGYLWGPFTSYLPNFNDYVDAASPEVAYDFGSPTEGFEAPYGKTQMEMWVNSDVVPTPPTTVEEFKAFCEANPGKVTYPALPDFTGSAFVRNIIYELCGWEQFQTMEADYETVKEAIAPALDYLRSLNPYLWNEGRTFPDSSTTVDAMFTDGELVLAMSYSPYGVAVGIENGVYTPTTRTFLFENGTIGNTNYMSIAFNSPNPAGAMVVINAMISAQLQLSQYEKLRNLPVVSTEKLSDEFFPDRPTCFYFLTRDIWEARRHG